MNQKALNIALAGHANVGKSVIFNQFTGANQHIGNWPGKTIAKREGALHYKGKNINVLDLPGIYSLSTYSMEEVISFEYITSNKPDFIANVVNSTNLSGNLMFSLQLLELEQPTVLVLNMVDLLKKKGITIDFEKLEEIIGIPVVKVAAIYGTGLTEILDRGIELIDKPKKLKVLKYGLEVEDRIELLSKAMSNVKLHYPKRWLAIKLLEKDEKITKLFESENPKILEKARSLCSELEKIHGHDSSIIIANERCFLVDQILKKVMQVNKPQKMDLHDKLQNITGHKVWGYFFMLIVFGGMLFSIFIVGNYFSEILAKMFLHFKTMYYKFAGNSLIASLIWGMLSSAFSLFEIAFPYILPFYLFLFTLEDCGYLPRVAYLLDNLMHKAGTHGKACIPLMLGLGCNVPACMACRIMETKRERLITGFLTAFVPCSAVTIIVMGLVGKYVGISWVVGLYLFIALTIILLGKIASKTLPGESVGLIMNMPDYRKPNFKTIMLQTWFKLREFIYVAAPLVIISGVIIEGMHLAKWFPYISNFLSPITVKWLGLPPITGILLIFGILRKELILVMLATLLGTTNFTEVLTSTQMITLALISMLYIPCIATIAVLKKEFGWQKALMISVFKVLFAILIGGVVAKLLSFISF